MEHPPNSRPIFVKVLEFVNFDLFQTEWLYTMIFRFEESSAFSQVFEDAGLDTSNYVIGIGPLFLVILIFPLWRLMKKRMHKRVTEGRCKCRCVPSFIRNPPEPWLSTGVIFIREACLELGLNAAITLKMTPLGNLVKPPELFQWTLALITLPVLILVPFL